MESSFAAVDLGAASGRVILGHFHDGRLRLEPVARFANRPVRLHDGLHWNIRELYEGVVDGLNTARRLTRPRSVGIDSWAIDYALLRGDRILGTPFHYRDERNVAAAEATHERVPFERLYEESGLQFLPFNTVYQLAAESSVNLESADRLLLIPDLIGYLLTGRSVSERTNASTTGLVSVDSGQWNTSLLRELGLPERLFTPLVDPGTPVGPTGETTGRLELVTVASHDTASAVAAVPATGDDFAYISSGTWSLVGVEINRPLTTPAARAANFTNELGVDDRIRFLKNVSGLWLLDESLRQWRHGGEPVDLTDLLAQAEAVGEVPTFDVHDSRFTAPGDMPARIHGWYAEHDIAPPTDRAATVRAIMESLAEAYAATIRQVMDVTGKRIGSVHMVGGGSRNALLCQLTADRTGLPVHAGPVEATAVGNLLIQARSHGVVTGSVDDLRAIVSASFPPTLYRPVARP